MKQAILRTLLLTIGIGCLSLPAIGQKPKVFPDYTYVYEPSDSLQMTIFDYAQYRAYYEKQYRDDPSTPSGLSLDAGPADRQELPSLPRLWCAT